MRGFFNFGRAKPETSVPEPVPAETAVDELQEQIQAQARVASKYKIDPRSLASIITHAWKAKQRLTPNGAASEPTDEQRRLLRHVDAILDEVQHMGFTLKDRLNEVFDYGLPEHVIASEPQAGLSKPIVKETIRPTIMWHEFIVSHGEVILATPMDADIIPTESSPT